MLRMIGAPAIAVKVAKTRNQRTAVGQRFDHLFRAFGIEKLRIRKSLAQRRKAGHVERPQ
ncbi:hypothetical protein ACM61V_18115 [Sphingomonas sp. TX0543]|uniref:hypothetical protein n=1 Tax=Sphingomonas sp. TX0543 TaxID=3399682 RepID=UPI003AFACCDF